VFATLLKRFRSHGDETSWPAFKIMLGGASTLNLLWISVGVGDERTWMSQEVSKRIVIGL